MPGIRFTQALSNVAGSIWILYKSSNDKGFVRTTDGYYISIPTDDNGVGRHQKMATRAFTDQWPVYIKNSRRGLRQDRPYATPEEFFGSEGASSGPDPHRPKWSDDDETDLMAVYGTSWTKECIDMIDGGDNDPHALWKGCIRLYQQDPFTLMNGMRVDATGSVPSEHDGKPQFNVVWSNGFCNKLTRIICHSFWRGPRRAEVLRLAMLYAVMCREDDRRGLHTVFRKPVSCPVLDQLFDEKNMSDAPLNTRHLELREKAVREGFMPTIESDMLSQLGDLVDVRPRDNLGGRIVVTVLDLSRIMCALDNLQNDGLPLHISAEASYQLFLGARGIDQLRRAYENCYLNLRRYGIVRERLASKEPEPGVEEQGLIIPETQPVSPQSSRAIPPVGTVDGVVPESQVEPGEWHPDDEWEGFELPDTQTGDDTVKSPELGTNQVSGQFGPTPESSGMADQGAQSEGSRSQRQPLQNETHESEDRPSLEGAQPLPLKRRPVAGVLRQKRRRSEPVVTWDVAVHPTGVFPERPDER